ncbi:hypothetical protein [Spirosoma sp. KNUC1025]|uniref:hypothetical protein n=1 Tax=Spirosoma sp. KNUC1025 TaxID=2894082 RepID=UPI00386884FB|nr:hypothetical protein LN737_30615 [Spirosoma sp. KNUC1025]
METHEEHVDNLSTGGGCIGPAFSCHGKPGPYQPEPIAEGYVVERTGTGVERQCDAE